jgi:hypothetical protein
VSMLSANQESFIAIMKESEELARKGFQLLLQRTDYSRFFDVLNGAGFFSPKENPAPVAVERENAVRISFWAPLAYLKAVAVQAGAQNDISLAVKIVDVIRSVSGWRDEKNEPRRNYRTNDIFAEILGIVPSKAIALGDIDLVREWFNDPYERMLVAMALDKGAMQRFLSSVDPEDWEKATRLLYQVTDITWAKQDTDEPTPSTVVDDFALGEILKHHAKEVGRKTKGHAAEVMIERVREVFITPMRREYSSLVRPAIEESAQNYQWRSADNRVVEGLRDVLLGWSEEEPTSTRATIGQMLNDDLQILRRVGVYILAQRWARMSDIYDGTVIQALFNGGHSHELYHLLQDHFAEMSSEQQSATVKAIESVPKPDYSGDAEAVCRQRQYRWLSVIVGKGCKRADERFAELDADPRIGKLGDHPDFDSYITGGAVGPGPTPFSVEELAALTQTNALVHRLDTFVPGNDWSGPTIGGLSSALGEAARANPDIFLAGLSQLLSAKPIYQQAVINGLRGAWEAKADANWSRGWEQLIGFLEQLVNDEKFWRQKDDEYRLWVVSATADLLNAGTKQDDHAYDPSLLPRTQLIIARLLEHAPGVNKPNDDATGQAINTSRGRVVEALYSQALRGARVSDQRDGTHRDAWRAISPLFDAELAKCVNANYEFSTLTGNYLPQLQYLDGKWIEERVDRIFPPEYEVNTVCALDGLGYAAFTRPVYELLAAHGIIDRALSLALKGRSTREKLLERIAAAYLWGIELLEGNCLTRIFDTATAADLDILIRVFWMVRNNDLTAEQKERIVAFWERAQTWERLQPQQPSRSVTTSALLAAYITTLTDREQRLLETAAPTVHTGHESYEFISELLRLAPQDPAGITRVLQAMIAAHVPEYDYEDRLVSLLQFLATHDQREAVILMSNELRHLPGAETLFKDLTR